MVGLYAEINVMELISLVFVVKNFQLTHQQQVSFQKTPRFKASNKIITVVLCSNASGGTHKLPLFAICTIDHKNQLAWTHLFKVWFISKFVPKVKHHLTSLKLPIKTLLVLNTPIHPEKPESEGEGRIKHLFLPPNVTSIIQPMDHRDIECFKRKYSRKFLSEISVNLDSKDNANLIDVLKINTKDMTYMAVKNKTFWIRLQNDSASLLHNLQQQPNSGDLVELFWIGLQVNKNLTMKF
ncbi:hypothetical protein PR048_004762 [Dryococelus australis]|uniref:DDE-1 domain-containing protein n=1 Tax=Dryococelus australis TaxID=614101 RepID=A0ABQ9I6A2_9NEOP|nr:hypothetical protein PR048_004762 [Dryococelus australis]